MFDCSVVRMLVMVVKREMFKRIRVMMFIMWGFESVDECCVCRWNSICRVKDVVVMIRSIVSFDGSR